MDAYWIPVSTDTVYKPWAQRTGTLVMLQNILLSLPLSPLRSGMKQTKNKTKNPKTEAHSPQDHRMLFGPGKSENWLRIRGLKALRRCERKPETTHGFHGSQTMLLEHIWGF